jgi:hypothetical protein
VLLAGAAMLGETVIRLTSQPVGFDERGLLAVGVVPRQRSLFTDMPRRAQAVGELLVRVRALPGVESAAITASPPFGTSYGSNVLEVSGRPGEALSAQRQVVSEGFFHTMGMRMLRGREFPNRRCGAADPRSHVARKSVGGISRSGRRLAGARAPVSRR